MYENYFMSERQLIIKDGIYVGYLRKSRADKELEKLKGVDTLSEHTKFIRERAEGLNINIKKWYKEVVSGDTISDRPKIQELLKDIESGAIDGVLVVDIDRLARGDTTDQGIISRTFKYTDTKIITLTKIYDPNNEDDEDFFEFNLFMSRKEYKTINKRQQRARISHVLSGKYCASEAPYGYKKTKLQYDKGFTLEIDEEKAKIVKMIFEKRKNGTGLNEICNHLNTLGIKPLRSDIWTPSTLTSILSNPVYVGKIRWFYNKTVKQVKNGELIKKRIKTKKEDVTIVEGLHPAIIDDKTFEEVNKNIIRNVSARKDLPLQNPLSGLVKCACCGRNMVRRPYSSKQVTKSQNNLNKNDLSTCLRKHKNKYSLSEIARLCGYTKYIVQNWFTPNIKRFVVPPVDAWYKLKKLLNIETDKFDKDIELYHTREKTIHIDSLMCPKAHCDTVSSHLYLVEQKILKDLNTHLKEKKHLLLDYNTNQNETETNDKMIIALIKNITKLENQLEKAYNLVEIGIYSPTEFANRSKKIKSEIQANNIEIAKIKSKKPISNMKPMLAQAEKVLKAYPKINSIEEKNKLLKTLIKQVTYIKLKGGKKNFDNFKLQIDFLF